MSGVTAGIFIFVVFMILCFLTVPIGISIGVSCVLYSILGGSVDMNYITTNMFTGCDSLLRAFRRTDGGRRPVQTAGEFL